MDEFVLLMRLDIINKDAQPTPEQLKGYMKKYHDWVGDIAAQNKLSNRGNRLENAGKVVKGSNVVTDGPYIEIKESIGGYTIVKSSSIEDAVELAKGCPIFITGGNVEAREISVL
jgi:hypothetical protein